MAFRLACQEVLSTQSSLALGDSAALRLCRFSSSTPSASASSATSNRAASGSSASSSDGSTTTRKGFVARGTPEFNQLMVERKLWRKNVNQLLGQWRREIVQQAKLARVDTPIGACSASLRPASPQFIASKQAQQEVREAQVEVDKAQQSLHHMRGLELRQQAAQATALNRQKALLEASRNWITRETLADRVSHALDNPVPFGFTTTIVTNTTALPGSKPKSSSVA